MPRSLNGQHTKQLIDNVKAENPVLIESSFQIFLPSGDSEGFRTFSEERVSIRDLVTILEALADGAKDNKGYAGLTEHVGTAWKDNLLAIVGQDGVMRVIVLDAEIERTLSICLMRV